MRALVEGTADVHPYTRAEPSDAIVSLLYGLPDDDPAVVAFDVGARRCWRPIAATRRAPSRRTATISRCAPRPWSMPSSANGRKSTVTDLHRRFAYWLRWAETLVYDRGLDLRREFYRTLALTQDIAAAAGLPPRWLLPLWLGACEEAGERGRFDDSYLTVGLVGLRRLPLGEEDSANEEAALHGLARWAARQRPAKPRFLREWHVLEGAFPRDASYWTALVGQVLAAVEADGQTFPAAAWWREDVELHPRERPETTHRIRPRKTREVAGDSRPHEAGFSVSSRRDFDPASGRTTSAMPTVLVTHSICAHRLQTRHASFAVRRRAAAPRRPCR